LWPRPRSYPCPNNRGRSYSIPRIQSSYGLLQTCPVLFPYTDGVLSRGPLRYAEIENEKRETSDPSPRTVRQSSANDADVLPPIRPGILTRNARLRAWEFRRPNHVDGQNECVITNAAV